MDRVSFERWLREYVRRQEQGDATVVRELWAEDGVYWWGPFNEPRRGVQAIYEHHRNALSHQSRWTCAVKTLAVTAEHGIAHFRLTLDDHVPGEPNTYDGIFLVCLNDEGKCTRFEEWYHGVTTDRN